MFEKFKKSRQNRINAKVEKTLKEDIDRKFDLYKEIQKSPYYRTSGSDENARKFLASHLSPNQGNRILPGQLVLFRYFEPKTKEQLEYYDASPCTIFFGVVNTKEGKRYLGFNIHYYPPKIRYKVMDRIFELYRPIYTKYYKDGTKKEVDAMDYKFLMDQLIKSKLDFGVRMYIPSLVAEAYEIPPKMWQVAVFTEGWFKKVTARAIIKYWKNWKS